MLDPCSSSIETIERTAFSWVQRDHAGLTESERADLDSWLSADMRHLEKFEELKSTWTRFEEFSNEIVLQDGQPRLSRFTPPKAPADIIPIRPLLPYVAAAAVLVAALFLWRQPVDPAVAPVSFPALVQQRTLEDGSTVDLNRGAEVASAYGPSERRVRLVRGEALFTVAKNPSRPFIVEVGGIEVRAVGTVFNVRLDNHAVEVVVTEGKVQVASPQTTIPLLEAGQSTTVSLAQTAIPQVDELTPVELESKLLWQPKLLDFDDAPLSEIIAEFNRRNPVRLVIEQDSLRARRMSASFRSDNIEGFVRLLESHFAVRAEHRGDREIALTRP
jgi:transmembrane sensor